MPNYEKLYFTLFNSLTDAIEEMERQNYGNAVAILQAAQQQAEELYMDQED